MKRYFKPGACLLASHIVLRALGADFTLKSVDTQTQRTESGIDLTDWPFLKALGDRVAARPSVKAAMGAQGLDVQ